MVAVYRWPRASLARTSTTSGWSAQSSTTSSYGPCAARVVPGTSASTRVRLRRCRSGRPSARHRAAHPSPRGAAADRVRARHAATLGRGANQRVAQSVPWPPHSLGTEGRQLPRPAPSRMRPDRVAAGAIVLGSVLSGGSGGALRPLATATLPLAVLEIPLPAA